MIGPSTGTVRVFPGPRDFALLHERAMPQKDQLCGAFWGSLTLRASGHAASQEEVALRAGTTLAEGDPAGWLPPGASPRIDYAATIPVAIWEMNANGQLTELSALGIMMVGGLVLLVTMAYKLGARIGVRDA